VAASLSQRTTPCSIHSTTFALLGTSLPEFNLAIGASVLWGELSSVEGVKLLFPRSPVVLQNGSLAQYRLGIVREMDGDERFDAVLIRSVFKMRYDVGSLSMFTQGRQQLQFNPEYDQTNLWGLQLRFTRPLGFTWRIGALFTTNWKDHPKIPNYELMSIPRDPGNSTAYNLGIGLFSQKEYSFFGIDLIYEPITTATWAEADRPIPLPGNQIFPAGMKTVENFFDFSNWIVKIGFKIGGGSDRVLRQVCTFTRSRMTLNRSIICNGRSGISMKAGLNGRSAADTVLRSDQRAFNIPAC